MCTLESGEMIPPGLAHKGPSVSLSDYMWTRGKRR